MDIYTNKAKHAIILRHPLYGDKRSTLAPDIINIVRYHYYENSLKLNGLMAEQTIRTGLWYANALILRHRGIEAQRLIEKLVTASHCVHGPGHNYTCVLMNGLKIARNTATWMNDANSYISRPSDTNRWEKFVLSQATSKSQGKRMMKTFVPFQVISYYLKKTAR